MAFSTIHLGKFGKTPFSVRQNRIGIGAAANQGPIPPAARGMSSVPQKQPGPP
jgi:hypothetical protein